MLITGSVLSGKKIEFKVGKTWYRGEILKGSSYFAIVHKINKGRSRRVFTNTELVFMEHDSCLTIK